MQPLAMLIGMRWRIGLFYWLSITVVFLPSSAMAMDMANPFPVSNSSPVVLIYGLPEIGRAFLLEQGQGQVELSLLVTNNFLQQRSAMEELQLDGESYRYRLRWEFAPLDKLEIGLEIPCLLHDGGGFDSSIDDFHHIFGFPRGERTRTPDNQLSYHYRTGAQVPLDFNRADSGLGDLRFTAAWQLMKKPDSALALRGSLKLPTGDSNHLTGSGGTDLALWVVGAKIYSTRRGLVSLYGSIGGLWLGRSDVLSDFQRHLVWIGGLGAGWSPLPWLKLQLQADAHSAFYQESQLRAINGESMALSFGSVFALNRNQEIELAIVEDVLPETAPDVAFHLAWRYRY